MRLHAKDLRVLFVVFAAFLGVVACAQEATPGAAGSSVLSAPSPDPGGSVGAAESETPAGSRNRVSPTQDGQSHLATGGAAVAAAKPSRLDWLSRMIPRWLSKIRRGPIVVIFVLGVALKKGYSAITRRIRRSRRIRRARPRA